MKVQIGTPKVPNFIQVIVGKESSYHALTSFTDQQLEEVAKEWRKDLFKNRDRQAANSFGPIPVKKRGTP